MNSIVIKLSGEFLLKENLEKHLTIFLNEIKKLRDNNIRVGIVIGGGNLFRGRDHEEMTNLNRDTMGMLASVMNAIHLEDYLVKFKINTIVSCPFILPGLLKNYSDEDIKKYSKDNVIVFGGGIGKINYSTDTKCFEVAKLLESNLIIKITNVDGIYDSDPKNNKNAHLIRNITYDEVIEKKLKIMDTNIMGACKLNDIKIKVINMNKIAELLNDDVGSYIGG